MTSIEWLMRQLFGEDFRMTVSDHQLDLFQQAETMHNEEIADAFYYGKHSEWHEVAEGYYNETFKNE